MDDMMLPVQKVADFLGINMPQIRNLINAGKLRGVMEKGKMVVSAESVTSLVSTNDKYSHLKAKVGALTGIDVPSVEVPAMPAAPEIPEAPSAPEMPEIPETPSMPEMPDVPEAPSVPEMPEVPDLSAELEAAVPEVSIPEPAIEPVAAAVAATSATPPVELVEEHIEEIVAPVNDISSDAGHAVPAKVASKVEAPAASGGMGWLLPLLGLLVLAALAYFAFTQFSGGSPAGEDGAGAMMTDRSDTTITLIENPWPASELNAAVAANLLKNELGYTVEVVSLDENAQWDALAAGDADASLEVWPSGHGERIAEYIDGQGLVANGGDLGPSGEIGWYVPTYVVTEHPELATWEGFQDAGNAALFSTAETGSNGRFLGADPSWVQYDEDIITNLGLPLQVIWAGSEEALLAEVSSSYSREEPVLFYFYSPHAIFSQFELTKVELPAYSADCYAGADSGGIACAYPPDNLMKIFSADLGDKAPEAFNMLTAMNYSNSDQITMLGALEDGLSTAEAAQKWIDNNGAVWADWVK